MANLIARLSDGSLSGLAAVVARARVLAQREITRERTAEAFDRLLGSEAVVGDQASLA